MDAKPGSCSVQMLLIGPAEYNPVIQLRLRMELPLLAIQFAMSVAIGCETSTFHWRSESINRIDPNYKACIPDGPGLVVVVGPDLAP